MNLLKLLATAADPINIHKTELTSLPTGSLTGSNGGTGSIDTILHIVFGIGGGVALIIIVVAGFRFITSQGNPEKATTARNTIIYALVGLVVCILAYNIVSFVLVRI